MVNIREIISKIWVKSMRESNLNYYDFLIVYFPFKATDGLCFLYEVFNFVIYINLGHIL